MPRELAIGLAAALTLSNTQFDDALRKGDDSQYVDATTAQDIGVAPKPETLGQQRFDRTFPYKGAVKIVSAGAGFLVQKSFGDDSNIARRRRLRRVGPRTLALPAHRARVAGRPGQDARHGTRRVRRRQRGGAVAVG